MLLCKRQTPTSALARQRHQPACMLSARSRSVERVMACVSLMARFKRQQRPAAASFKTQPHSSPTVISTSAAMAHYWEDLPPEASLSLAVLSIVPEISSAEKLSLVLASMVHAGLPRCLVGRSTVTRTLPRLFAPKNRLL